MQPEDVRPERSDGPAPDDTVAHPAEAGLWEQLLSRENLALALRRVERNAGAAGIDGMTTGELRPWLKEHWPGVRAALDAGTYRPQPVRRVMIPKPAGGRRALGVPTVLDRMIQQAVLQVLEPRFELIRRFLVAGVMADGVLVASDEGTPQGSPLSPLLGNVMLDDLDAELEQRGHRFVRYADDVMIYVESQRAGQRVLESVTQFVEARLRLRINADKSAVATATSRTFLGFAFYRRDGKVKIGVDRNAPKRAKQRLRQVTARTWGVPMDRRIHAINRFTVGWTAYFALADGQRPFSDLDEWLRRRLRQVRWKEWKRYHTRWRNLRALGMPERAAREWAGSQKGPWRIAGSYVLQRALPNAYWTNLGLHGFNDPYRRFPDATRTAGCGPACPVVWEGPG